MTVDGFDATFRIGLGRTLAWQRLAGDAAVGDRVWLAGFDAQVIVEEVDAGVRLRCTKDEQPCIGTDIVVVLEDEETGTLVRVVQSRFGPNLPASHDAMQIGWNAIVADLETFLETGVAGTQYRGLFNAVD